MKRKTPRKAPRRRAARLRWKPYGGFIFGPVDGPHGSSAGAFVVRHGGRYGVMALATPTGAIGMGASGVLDDHAHAVIAEDVRSLAEAKRLGEAWLRKFRKGLVLAPCACEDMVEAGAPSATRPSGGVRGLLPAASPSAADVVALDSSSVVVTRDSCPTCGKTYAEHRRTSCENARGWFDAMRDRARQIRSRKAWLDRERSLYRGQARASR